MNRYIANGVKTVDSHYKVPGKTKWDLKDKLLLGSHAMAVYYPGRAQPL